MLSQNKLILNKSVLRPRIELTTIPFRKTKMRQPKLPQKTQIRLSPNKPVRCNIFNYEQLLSQVDLHFIKSDLGKAKKIYYLNNIPHLTVFGLFGEYIITRKWAYFKRKKQN